MRTRCIQGVVSSILLLFLIGCAHKVKMADPGERVDLQVTSIYFIPEHPEAFGKFRAIMTVENTSHIGAANVAYIIRLPASKEEIGRGYIGKIMPGDTLKISSDDVLLPKGEYRIEGQIDIPPSHGHPDLHRSKSAMIKVEG